MLRIMKRIIDGIGKRKKRFYIGLMWSFLASSFTAMPIMGAAYLLGLMLVERGESTILTPIWALYVFIFMVLAILGRFLFSHLQANYQDVIGYAVVAEERIKIGAILKRVSLGFFERHKTGKIAGAVTTDLSLFEIQAMQQVNAIASGYIGVFTMILFLAFSNLWVAIIALLGVLLSSCFLSLHGKRSRGNASAHQKAQDEMTGATLEYVRGIAIVKAYGQEGEASKRIRDAYGNSRLVNNRIEQGYIPLACLHLLSLKFAAVAIAFVAALLAISGVITISTFLILAVFSFVIFGNLEQIHVGVHMLEMLEHIMDKLDNMKQATFIDKAGKEQSLSNFHIQMEDVFFGYDKRQVLKNVSFSLPQNTVTAIVGSSGSGKTTICNLLARFYDVTSGKITIGGVDIKTLTCDSLLSHISMVFQNVYLFHDTIRNNISFGKPNAKEEEIVATAKKAMCHDFIMALPLGYDTVIGEGGSTLSGGEKQRISIARAMLKDAPIVILDEATASIDPENESLIQEALTALTKGKTVIIIAHRLATIEHANQILVVDEGEIVQQGTHVELLEQAGVYRRFVEIRQKAEGWKV